jgi:hypothetical protein
MVGGWRWEIEDGRWKMEDGGWDMGDSTYFQNHH